MDWYYFDSRDDDEVIVDDVGLEVADLETVKVLAAKGLAELAVEVLPGSSQRCLGIDVRDDRSAPVLTTELIFKARVVEADLGPL
ncbi:MAG TPA: hypothetical protein VEA16_16400 [Vicinamibacterales bacterium]|nr:hypothetical protein [Vicinamibacterales bacterium]